MRDGELRQVGPCREWQDPCTRVRQILVGKECRTCYAEWVVDARSSVANVGILDCGELIESLERDLGVSTEIIARAVEVDRRTVERWRANTSVPQGKTRQNLKDLVDLRDELLTIFGTSTAAQEWLRAGSLYLGGFTPEEALKAGRIDRVRADLEGLAAGVYL
jgi:hypothetical protein